MDRTQTLELRQIKDTIPFWGVMAVEINQVVSGTVHVVILG